MTAGVAGGWMARPAAIHRWGPLSPAPTGRLRTRRPTRAAAASGGRRRCLAAASSAGMAAAPPLGPQYSLPAVSRGGDPRRPHGAAAHSPAGIKRRGRELARRSPPPPPPPQPPVTATQRLLRPQRSTLAQSPIRSGPSLSSHHLPSPLPSPPRRSP